MNCTIDAMSSHNNTWSTYFAMSRLEVYLSVWHVWHDASKVPHHILFPLRVTNHVRGQTAEAGTLTKLLDGTLIFNTCLFCFSPAIKELVTDANFWRLQVKLIYSIWFTRLRVGYHLFPFVGWVIFFHAVLLWWVMLILSLYVNSMLKFFFV